MTRINADIEPAFLTDQHLMAEYRELPMVPAALRRSLRTKAEKEIIDKIPKKFTLNSGHVTFYYDKLKFLENRYERLKEELRNRGYQLDETRDSKLGGFPECFYGDWECSSQDLEIIKERIIQKLDMKKDWYKFHSEPIDDKFLQKFKEI